MNILILGGNRYFGKEILKKLLSKNHKIYLVNRCKKKNLSHKNLKIICDDRKNIKKYEHLFENVYFEKIFDNIAYDVQEVKSLINFLKGKFYHYILTSSSISYLDKSLVHETKEKDWNYGKLTSIFKAKYNSKDIKYAINKRKIEKFVIKKRNILSTILRIPNVIGKNDFSKKTTKLFAYNYNFLNNKNFGNRFIQFVFKDDLVRIILKIIYSKPCKKEEYNIANEKIMVKDFYSLVKKNPKIRKKYPILNNEFPIPTDSLINCQKIKKKFGIKFSSLNKILNLI